MKDKHIGRPFAYPDTEKGFRAFKYKTYRYNLHLLNGNRFTVIGWANSLGITRQTLYAIIARGGKWADLYDEIKNGIEHEHQTRSIFDNPDAHKSNTDIFTLPKRESVMLF